MAQSATESIIQQRHCLFMDASLLSAQEERGQKKHQNESLLVKALEVPLLEHSSPSPTSYLSTPQQRQHKTQPRPQHQEESANDRDLNYSAPFIMDDPRQQPLRNDSLCFSPLSTDTPDDSTGASSFLLQKQQQQFLSSPSEILEHSATTIPTSNVVSELYNNIQNHKNKTALFSPPTTTTGMFGDDAGNGRRTVFGNRVQKKYRLPTPPLTFLPSKPTNLPTSTIVIPPHPSTEADLESQNIEDDIDNNIFPTSNNTENDETELLLKPIPTKTTEHPNQLRKETDVVTCASSPVVITECQGSTIKSTSNSSNNGNDSDAAETDAFDTDAILFSPNSFSNVHSPLHSPTRGTPSSEQPILDTIHTSRGHLPVSPLTPQTQQQQQRSSSPSTKLKSIIQYQSGSGENLNTSIYSSIGSTTTVSNNSGSLHAPKKKTKVHETIHAQSLLLGLAFMAIWSPSNIMAPNLTQIGESFNMNNSERDLYLGSYCALATGVLSFPISAMIGIMTDVYPRKILFVGTAVGGAISSTVTGLSMNYAWLFFARLLNGGFMASSVPIAFSLLGDLFATEERNAASSALTAMMGVGIILGQVYAGVVGSTMGWSHGFYVSSVATIFLAILVSLLVREPVRGGKEKVLQDMIKQGTKYEKRLTWDGFIHAMKHNTSNQLIISQGFFASLPWGIIFVFLNDYLSQERGFSVPDATYIVFLFGIGCAFGGILGGYYGQIFQSWNRSYLPLFMSATTLLGIFPFLALLNGKTTNAHGYKAMGLSILCGFVASLPSVNVRPCLINVNPPETRGASLTAANLIINLARGIGPSCVTLMGSIFHVERKFSFNVTIIIFWTICAIQLLFLAKSLPKDQDAMEMELAKYAENQISTAKQERRQQRKQRPTRTIAATTASSSSYNVHHRHHKIRAESDASIVSIEERMTSFDGVAARESLSFVTKGIKEMQFGPFQCGELSSSSSSQGDFDDDGINSNRNNNTNYVYAIDEDYIDDENDDYDNYFNGTYGAPANARAEQKKRWILQQQQQRAQLYYCNNENNTGYVMSVNDNEDMNNGDKNENDNIPNETTSLLV